MPENLLNLLTPEAIAALIALLNSIITIIFSDLRARYTARNEIKKLKMGWKREDKVTEDQLFLDMSASVSKYIQSGWSRHQRDALAQIAVLQSCCHKDYYEAIENLQKAVLADDIADTVTALSAIHQLRVTTVKSK